jgi:hypothetical protein
LKERLPRILRLIQKSSMHNTAYVQSKIKVRDAVRPLVNSDGIKESDHEEMCNILNDYFGNKL